jgi:hypothetical protein
VNQQQLNIQQAAYMLKELEQRSLTRGLQLRALADLVTAAPVFVAALFKLLGDDLPAMAPNADMEKISKAAVDYLSALANDCLQDKKTFDFQISQLKLQLGPIQPATVMPGGKTGPFSGRNPGS